MISRISHKTLSPSRKCLCNPFAGNVPGISYVAGNPTVARNGCLFEDKERLPITSNSTLFFATIYGCKLFGNSRRRRENRCSTVTGEFDEVRQGFPLSPARRPLFWVNVCGHFSRLVV